MNPNRWNLNFVTRGLSGVRRERPQTTFDLAATSGRSLQLSKSAAVIRRAADAASYSLRHITTWVFAPRIGPVLRNRLLCALLLAAWFAQVGLVYQGLSAWSCPLQSTMRLPCPGCGLTRSTVCLLKGHGRAALAQHPMAPAVLAAPMVLLPGAVLPKTRRKRFLKRINMLEQRIPVVGIILIGFLLHWAIALVAGPEVGFPG